MWPKNSLCCSAVISDLGRVHSAAAWFAVGAILVSVLFLERLLVGLVVLADRVGGDRVVPGERAPHHRVSWHGEVFAGDAGVRVEAPPDVGREGAAGDRDAVDRGHRDLVRLRVADPGGGREVRLLAGQPAIGEVVGRAGLPGLADAAGVGAGAAATAGIRSGEAPLSSPGMSSSSSTGPSPIAKACSTASAGTRCRSDSVCCEGCRGCRPPASRRWRRRPRRRR